VAALKDPTLGRAEAECVRSPRPSGRGRIEGDRFSTSLRDIGWFSTAFGPWPH